MPEEADQSPENPSDALFTVVAGEGDGAMLGLAAGDTAGGAWDLGYSAITEQATVIAYQLIVGESLDLTELAEDLLELDGFQDEDPVVRAESAELRLWLNRARAGSPVPGEEPSLDGAARAAILGVAHRRDADALIHETIELGRMFHNDGASVMAGVLAAAAVAASCFAQSGLDLVTGVAETANRALPGFGSEFDRLPSQIEGLVSVVGEGTGQKILDHVGGDREDPVQMVLSGLLLAAPVVPRHHLPIEQAARLGGSTLGAIVGAIVGARVGIRAWPWAFANDTWFAEIGRRMVRGPREVRDLPIPYAVEQHLMSGGRPGFH